MRRNPVNLAEKLSEIQDYWNPRIAGELNGQQVKLAKVKGEFVWHRHQNEDELFLVLKGVLSLELRDGTITLRPGRVLHRAPGSGAPTCRRGGGALVNVRACLHPEHRESQKRTNRG